MNTVEWAKEELDRLVPEGEGAEEQKYINDDILSIVQVFSEQGHSGFTASYALGMLTRLLKHLPLTPLNGEEDEWLPVYDDSRKIQQNKRCSAVFRSDGDNSSAYYINGKVFSDDGGESWFTDRNSFIPIIFPYQVPEKPEYVYLDVKINYVINQKGTCFM